MKAHLRNAVFLAIAIVLFALFLRQANFAEVWNDVRNARLEFVLLAVAVTMVTYLLRAFRWQYLLRALGPTHYGTAFRTTIIGFAASSLLPGRVGEVLRPYLLAREENLNATSAFATVIFERLLDMIAVLVLFGVFLLVFDPRQTPVDAGLLRNMRVGGLMASVGSLTAMVAIFVLAGHPDSAARLALRIEHVLPRRVALAFSRLVHTFVLGLSVVRQPSRLMMSLVLSFPLWLSIATGIFLATRAFHIAMPFVGSFAVTAMLVVGVAIPTPASVGGFEYFYQLAVMAFYAAPRDQAIGAALVLHAISFLPVTLLGIIFMAREGLSLARVRRLAKLAGEQEQEGR